MVLLISSSALAPFRPPPSTLDESLKEPSRLSDRIVVCDSSSSKAFVPIFHFQTSSFWKVTDLFLCIDEREEVEERGFFPHRFFTLSYFLYPSFRQPSKVFDKRARHAWSSPSLFWPKCKQTHQTSCEALQTSVYTLLDDKRAFYFVAENLGRIYRKLWLSKVYFFVGKRNTLRFLATLGKDFIALWVLDPNGTKLVLQMISFSSCQHQFLRRRCDDVR